MAEPSFTIGGTDVAPASHEVVTLPVTTGLNGAALDLTVHVVHGARPGPTLALLSTLHGGEWFSIQHWDVQPDLISFAKGVNSGYVPLGGVVISADVAKGDVHFAPRRDSNPLDNEPADINSDGVQLHLVER